MPVEFRIPYPPSVNNYWRSRVITSRRGKPIATVYISAKGRAYRKAVKKTIVERFGTLRPTHERLRLEITAVMPDRRIRDLSNLLKAAEDALTHALVWGDDNQIDDLRVIRGRVCKPGWLDVSVTPIEEPQRALVGDHVS